jgi:PAS domain S-box-containing protein
MTTKPSYEELEKTYGAVVESSMDAVLLTAPDGRIIFANRAACDLFQMTLPEFNKGGRAAITDETDPRLARALAERACTGNFRGLIRLRKKDGTVFDGEVSSIIFEDAAGEKRTSMVVRDISQQKKAEEKLKNQNAFIKMILDNLPIGLAVNRVSDNTVIYINRKYEEIYGWPKESFSDINSFFSKVYPDPDYRKEVQERIMADILSLDPARMHWDNIAATGMNGEKRIVSATNIPLFDQDLMISTAQDVTGRWRGEEEKAKLQDLLFEARKMEAVGQLAGGVAHDFNNMLGVILGHAEMALEQTGPAQPLYADLEEIRKATLRSADLTRKLLAFARRQIANPSVLDLNDTVASMLKMIYRLIGENISLSWKPAAFLWPVRIDPVQVDQILSNLAANARDAIVGKGSLTVETANWAFDERYCAAHPGIDPGEYVMLSVSDTGKGMDKDTLSHIFEPFFTTKEVGKGTGMGLSSIYGIVKQNKGFIDVHSELGKGTTFKIYLPRYVDKTNDVDPRTPGEPVNGGTETILLVEDEPAILKISELMLESLGYTVLTAPTPSEAMRLAGDHAGKIHLLMTDVVMPGMNGRDLARQLLSLYPDLKRLFMSGYTADIIARHGIVEKGVHFLQKPFSRKELAAKIREALEES